MEALCNRTCIIRDGVIVRTVSLDELIRMGESAVEVTARGCTEKCIASIDPYIESKSVTGEESFLVVREQRNVKEVIRRLYESDAEVIRVVNQHQSLENVFLHEVEHRTTGVKPGPRRKKPALVGS